MSDLLSYGMVLKCVSYSLLRAILSLIEIKKMMVEIVLLIIMIMTMIMIIIMKTKIKMITMIMMVIMKRVIGRAISNWLCAKRVRNSGNN